uniref:Permease n=1 Tax=Solibacter usitatus (strain Ellin6076) TaxID=234267 RepID=Q025E1_SOLUE
MNRREREVEEELQSHIRMAIADRVRAGEDPVRARAAVLKEFGNVALTLESTRAVWSRQWLHDVAADLRYGLRTLARSPAFTIAAAASLAIGIAATTSLFSVLQHVVWNSLPYPDAQRLAIVWNVDPRVSGGQSPLSVPDWQDLRAQSAGAASLAAFRNRPAFLNAGEQSIQLELHEVSADFLPLLGVSPALGRYWEDGEAATGQVVVISDHLWRTAFSGARDVIARRIVVGQRPYQIVGVMPPGFRSPSVAAQTAIRLSPDDSVWAPLVPGPAQIANRGNRGLRVLARLGAATGISAAQNNLAAAAARLASAYPDSNANIGVQVLPLVESIAGSARPALAGLLSAAGLFLLIACANVASLLLARGSARRREFATRSALGAGRARLLRQLLTESLLLAMLGGCGGIVLASAFLALVRRAAATLEIPRLADSALDLPILAIAIVLTLATGLLFGLTPALQITRLAGNRSTADPRGVRLRQLLIAGVTAVTLVLVFSASTLLDGLRGLTGGQSEAAARTFTFQTTLTGTRWTHSPLDRQFYDALRERLGRLPRVESVGVTTSILQIGDNSGTLVTVSGAPPLPADQQPIAAYTMADAGFFHLAGLALHEGRPFDEHDTDRAPLVAIVNEAFARAVIPDGPVLGRKIRLLGVAQEPMEIVGLVSDARSLRLGAQERPRVFYPYSQSASTRLIAIVRMAAGAPLPVREMRAIVRELDSTLPIFELHSLEDLAWRATSAPRWGSVLLGGFAVMALLLASAGVMGVVAFVVCQRTRECGIRLALGSTPAAVQWLVARQGLWPVACGLLGGAAAAGASRRVIAANLVGMESGSTPMLAATLLLAAAAALAIYIPARRAASVDPALTLRCD